MFVFLAIAAQALTPPFPARRPTETLFPIRGIDSHMLAEPHGGGRMARNRTRNQGFGRFFFTA
ncbi:MAG: hypothetical protein ABEJ71_02535 [Halodesulfurarchaeum sp.]